MAAEDINVRHSRVSQAWTANTQHAWRWGHPSCRPPCSLLRGLLSLEDKVLVLVLVLLALGAARPALGRHALAPAFARVGLDVAPPRREPVGVLRRRGAPGRRRRLQQKPPLPVGDGEYPVASEGGARLRREAVPAAFGSFCARASQSLSSSFGSHVASAARRCRGRLRGAGPRVPAKRAERPETDR